MAACCSLTPKSSSIEVSGSRLPPKYRVELVTDPSAVQLALAPQAASTTYCAARPFMAKVVSNMRLTSQTHFQDVRRLVLDVSAAGSALAYGHALHTVWTIQGRLSTAISDPPCLSKIGTSQAMQWPWRHATGAWSWPRRCSGWT